ncbi:MAG: hypothetical protein E7559_02975 [Ruminococcaceae bacterium]|nr:hypothetical protein [Oscillospiraceae bacterium]
MYTACAAVLLVVLVTMFMFARSHRRDYSAAIIPLTFVPAAHLLGGLVSTPYFLGIGPKGWLYVCIALDLLALLNALLFMPRLAQRIKGKKSRRSLMILCIGFSCVLTAILTLDLVSELVKLYGA